MRKLFCLIFIFIPNIVSSQEIPLKYSREISPDSIKEYLFVLASDSMEGRETGQPGQKRASRFLASKYNSWNLTPAGTKGKKYFQNHPINLKNNKTRNLIINGENFLFGKNFYYSDFYSDSTLYLKDFIFIGTGARASLTEIFNSDKYSKKNLIVVDLKNDSLAPQSFKTISHSQKKNAPAFIFYVTTPENIKKYFIDGANRDTDNLLPIRPFIFITYEAANKFFKTGAFKKILDNVDQRNRPVIKKCHCPVFVSLVKNTDELCGQNVIAFIPGSDLDSETVVISSHYDHLGKRDSLTYYGADDNASGTSAVLELARVFTESKKEGHGPRRNILFLNFSGEEKGLLGSAWYVANPSFPLSNTITDLNIDMIGRVDSIHDSTGIRNYIYIIGSDKLSTELHTINETNNNNGPKLKLDYLYNTTDDPNRFYSRSDHYNFVKNGIPVIFYFDGKHSDYHKPTDTPEKIDTELLANRARLVFLTAWELANRNNRIVVDKKNDLNK